MRTFLLVCAAGAAGTGLRYGIGLAFSAVTRKPLAVLSVNVVGSFAIGALMAWGMRREISPTLLVSLTSGLLGGFTTYSAFNYDVTAYIAAGEIGKATAYAFVMVGGCLVAGLAGLYVGR